MTVSCHGCVYIGPPKPCDDAKERLLLTKFASCRIVMRLMSRPDYEMRSQYVMPKIAYGFDNCKQFPVLSRIIPFRFRQRLTEIGKG